MEIIRWQTVPNLGQIKTILFVAGDPGGASVLVPVINTIFENLTIRAHVFAYNQAVEIFHEQDIAHKSLDSDCNDEMVEQLIKQLKPDLVFTATSCNEFNFEHLFVASAGNLGIPSAALLDYWSNYSSRFSDYSGRLKYLPDHVLAMDELAVEEAKNEGVPECKLHVVGHPGLEAKHLKYRNLVSQVIGKEQNAATKIGFISQPFSELHDIDAINTKLGFDELSVLKLLIKTLESCVVDTQKDIRLSIKPHPRETVDKFEQINSAQIKIAIEENMVSDEFILASDIVIGMNSICLIEACLLGKAVISVQPGLIGHDSLPTNRSGLSKAVYSEAQLSPLLSSYLNEKQRLNERQFNPPGYAANALERTLKFINSILTKERSVLANV